MDLLTKNELAKAKVRLVKHGFISSDKRKELEEKKKRSGEKDFEKFIKSLEGDAADYADVEKVEVNRLEAPVPTDYPKPKNSYRFIYESPNASIEEVYFWLLHHLKVDQGFKGVIKISDIFTASEMSAIGGTMQYRLAQQQEKASTYLRGISELVRQLFQIVREVRILNEKISYYDDSRKEGSEGLSAEMALKDQWISLVEQGTKNPGSVYGLGQQLNFVTLPDLFFRIKVRDKSQISEKVNKLEFNPKIKEVLSRKLYQYYNWKEKTEQELKSRKGFMVKYLRQHYNTIRLYMNWTKPYLKTAKRLGGGALNLESAEIATAFESSKVDLEFLSYKPPVGDYYPVIIATFNFRTMPQMSFMSEGYQKGPIHVGQVEVNLRSYIWTQKEMDGYIKYREEEDLELIADIDETILEAMRELGDELKDYLKSEGEILERKTEKKEERKQETMLEPFTALFGGFKELFSIFPSFGGGEKKGKSDFEKEGDKEGAEGAIKFSLYQSYKNFKKAHGFLSW